MLALLTGLLVALGVLMAGAVRAPVGHAATTPTVYADSVGDAVNGAADIQSIAISDTDGLVTVVVTAPGLQLGPSDYYAELDIAINADQSTATGDTSGEWVPVGSDYMLFAGVESEGLYQGFGIYESQDGWIRMDESSTMSYSAEGGVYTWTFAASDFGGTGAFGIWAGAQTSENGFGDTTGDGWLTYELTSSTLTPSTPTGTVEPRPIMQLPDGKMYLLAGDEYHQISQAQFDTFGLSIQAIAYVGELYHPIGAPATDEQVQAMEAAYVQALNELGIPTTVPAVKPPAPPAPATPAVTTPAVVESPVINPPLTVPAKPRAGKYFTVSFPVTSSLTGQTLTAGKMICDPSVKSKVIPHFEHFKNGKATLRFVIPAAAKGKVLKVHLTMVLGDQSTTRIESFLVK
jgi:hypothetical protein